VALAEDHPGQEQEEASAGSLKSVAKALTELATDLEQVDAPPTAGQRALFEYQAGRLAQLEEENEP